MVQKKQRKEKRWIYAKKEVSSVWTDMTWWVHFQKLNLGLACQNGSRCWEQLICSVEMKRNPPPRKASQTKPIQIKVCFKMFRGRNSPFQIPKLLLGCTFHNAARTHHSPPWVCSFRVALYSSLPNKKAAGVCNANASVNGWRDQKSHKWETFWRSIMPWCTDFTLENQVIN